MVFQSYAIWPHMTIVDNVAYPLKIQKMSKSKRYKQAEDVLNLVRLEGMGARYPSQLSGGQQQRVALARALIMRPQVMLLDEPLSNLDAKLREEMRFEIKELQVKTGVTIVYVTHDQAEAMAMSDRIVVMNQGKIHQIGNPDEIYRKPADQFVADFVGLINFIPCRLDIAAGGVFIEAGDNEVFHSVSVPEETRTTATLAIRPENITLEKIRDQTSEIISGVIERATYMGSLTDYLVTANSNQIRVQVTGPCEFSHGDTVQLHFKSSLVFSD